MRSYRIYSLNDHGRIAAADDVMCPGDEAALAYAEVIFGRGVKAEIWQGTRCLGQVGGQIGGRAGDGTVRRSGALMAAGDCHRD